MKSKIRPPQVHVVLAESDAQARALLIEKFDQHGVAVVGVGSAVEFYQQLAKQTFDVAIVDVSLPDHSGFSIVEYLNKETQLGIIILSNSNSISDRVIGYEAGADSYLTKPIDGQELIFAVRNLAARLERFNPASNTTDTATESGPTWRLNEETWQLTAPCNYCCELSSKEMIFIKLLSEKTGVAIKRSVLLNVLGYPNNQHGGRALESMVLRLRKKLSACASGQVPVKTVHSVGYMFSSALVLV